MIGENALKTAIFALVPKLFFNHGVPVNFPCFALKFRIIVIITVFNLVLIYLLQAESIFKPPTYGVACENFYRETKSSGGVCQEF